MAQHQDRLVVRRTQAVQGHSVNAYLNWNGQPIGELELPFGAWLKFKRLLEKGVEQDARENYSLALKVSIQGMPVPEPVAAPTPAASEGLAESIIATFAEPTDDDPDIAAVELHEQRIRTARGGSNGGS